MSVMIIFALAIFSRHPRRDSWVRGGIRGWFGGLGGRRVSGFGWSVGFGGLDGRWVIENIYISGFPGILVVIHRFFNHSEVYPRNIYIFFAFVILAVIKNLGYPLLLAHTFRRYATLRDALQMWVNF